MTHGRLQTLGLAALLVVLAAVAIAVLDPWQSSSSPSPTPSAGSLLPSATGTLASDLEIAETGIGPRFPVEQGAPPTADVVQAKLWVRDGAWWGVLVADGTDELRIHRFDWANRAWIDTGTRVAPRATVLPDVLAEGDTLWVATGGQPMPRRGAALVRFTFDPELDRYVRDPDVPVTLTSEAVGSLTLARDAAGRLWVAWIGEDGMLVSRTGANDWRWSEPLVAPIGAVDHPPSAAAIVPYGNSVALVWTGRDGDLVSVAIAPETPDEAWERLDARLDGLRTTTDDISVRVIDAQRGPRLFAAVRTELAAGDPGPGDPRIVLVVFEPGGASRQHLVAQESDDHVGPLLLVDAENGTLYVVASLAGDDGAVVYKASDIDDVSFAPGAGTPLIEDAALSAVANASSTRQPLGSATGLVVLASDAETGAYAWVAARLPGPMNPDLGPVPEPVAGAETLLYDTFDPFEPGTALDPAWRLRSGGTGTIEVAETPDGRHVAVSRAADGSAVRMCREIVPVPSGRLRIEADVMLSRVGTSDATVTAVRHGGVQSAVVRLDDSGVFSYFDGASQVRSTIPYAAGVWYTSLVEVNIDAGTYDWHMQRSSDGVTVFTVTQAAWRQSTAEPLDEVCFESAASAGGASVLAVDRVRVGP